MNDASVVIHVIGGIGIALLAASLFLGDVQHFGHPDMDGPFSLPSVAGFIGAFGFGGAIAAGLTGGGAISVVVAVVAGIAVAVPAAFGKLRLARAADRMRTDATPTRDSAPRCIRATCRPTTSASPAWANSPRRIRRS